MRVSIFGLGYVGTVTTACLASNNHQIIGIDVDLAKVKLINQGKSPIIEKDLDELIYNNVKCERIKAVTDINSSILETDLSLICVGTPSNEVGSIDLTYILRVTREIGIALAQKSKYHIVVIRSTILPGTMEEKIIPLLERHSNKKAGVDFGVAVNPEFLREGSAVYDFYNPPKTVIGSLTEEDGKQVALLYEEINAPLVFTNIRTAEMVKYTDNAFHALKVTFANEIGLISKSLEIDSHELMSIFCQDTKLNLSAAYLRPGFAFGGSCLPKDIRALTYLARHRDLNLPVLNAIIPSNHAHIEHAIQLIRTKNKKKIGILGFAFKAGTDDLRGSPVVTLIETLLGQGYEIRVFDKDVSLARLRGTNKEFIEQRIPHIAALMEEKIEHILSFADILVIGNHGEEFRDIASHLKPDQYLVDLVRIAENIHTDEKYEGICW